jgi:small subunit ribosomal protein S1
MKQLEPTSVDHYIAEHQPGETVTGRVVEVKNDRAKVELGEGVFATCRLGGEEEQSSRGAGSGERGDISTMTAMLAQRWKQGGGAAETQKNAAKAGQIRNFRIVSLDPQQKKIQIELHN